MALRKITIALAMAVGLASAGAGIAHADVSITESSSGTGNNVLFNGTQTGDNNHPIYGILNANQPQVVQYSTTNTGVTMNGTGSAGQATITNTGAGLWTNLTTTVYQNNTLANVAPVSVEVFSLIASDNGSVTFTVVLNDKTVTTDPLHPYTLSKNGQNFFTFTAISGETIQSITFNSTANITDFEHNRIDLAGAQVPLPPAAALFGSGLAGLLLLGRRKLRKAAV